MKWASEGRPLSQESSGRSLGRVGKGCFQTPPIKKSVAQCRLSQNLMVSAEALIQAGEVMLYITDLLL